MLERLWGDRLGQEGSTGSGRSRIVETTMVSSASRMVAQPSRFVLERTVSGLSASLSTATARRTLTRGGMFLDRRYAISTAEYAGRDETTGSDMSLSLRFTGARLLHARRLSEGSALTVTLCRTLDDEGARSRVLVTSVFVPPEPSSVAHLEAGEDSGTFVPAWHIAHEDVVMHGGIPTIPQRQLPPLRPLTEGMVDENKLELWPADAYEWFARTKVMLHHAESAEAAAAALAEEDFAADATLVSAHAGFGSDARVPPLELVHGAEACSQCFSAKYIGPSGSADIEYTVQTARELVPGEVALVLLWIAADDGGGARSFIAESCLAVFTPEDGAPQPAKKSTLQELLDEVHGVESPPGTWRRVHCTLGEVRRHAVEAAQAAKL